jgi:PhzF family phenazine biosynthesis protein
VPFCGHATIALGAALASRQGDGLFQLELNDNAITVEGHRQGDLYAAALQSPPTVSKSLEPGLLIDILKYFNYSESDLDKSLSPAWINAGASHVVIALGSRAKLSVMTYPFELVRAVMLEAELVTIMFVYPESNVLFHSRNAFASGGVVEDPATGAATAAFAGYLRDCGWPHEGRIELIQGEDMGAMSRLRAEIPEARGSSIRVSGTTRIM